MSARGRIEDGFEAWGRLVCRHRFAVIALVCGATLALGSLAPGLRFDNSNENFLRGGDPVREAYDAFRARFGTDERMLILVQPDRLFEPDTLAKLRALHEEIEETVPYVVEVNSLVNARATRGEGDRLVVGELMEEWPETAEDLARLERYAVTNPLTVGNLVSAEADFAVIAIRPQTWSSQGERADEIGGFDDAEATAPAEAEPLLLTEAEVLEQIRAVREVIARHHAPDFRLLAAGGEIAPQYLNRKLAEDVRFFMALAFAAMLGWLAILFRRPSGVVLPLVVIFASLAATLGLMVAIGIPMSTTLQMLPVLLLTVGICDAIHILVIVYQQLEQGAARDDAIARALGHSGLAVLMTSVTTAAGLVSFVGAELNPIRQLGVIAPIGVMLAFVYSVTLLPALLALAPLGRRADAGRALRRWLDARLASVGEIVVRAPGRVVAGAGLVLALGAVGFSMVRVSHYALAWFPEEDPVRVASELIDRKLAGATALEVVVDTGRENGLHEPQVLERMDAALRWAEGLEGPVEVGKTLSLLEIVKETHQALNENRPESYAIPDDRQLLAQELLLFENSGSDDLEDWTDSQFRSLHLTLRIPWVDSVLYPPFHAELERGFRQILGPELPFAITGSAALFGQTFSALIVTMTRSYLIALCVITPMMVLLIGEWRRGIVAMLPNLIPVFLTLGFMGFLDVPLDASTLLIGCIVIGLAVDDTIHFMHKFNRYYEESGDPRDAVRQTLATTGSALLFTSLVLTTGFLIVSQGYMLNSVWFGTLAAFATVIAFAADVVLAPALMVLVSPAREPRAPSQPAPSAIA